MPASIALATMRVSTYLFSSGFVRRSLDEFKRLSEYGKDLICYHLLCVNDSAQDFIAIKMEGLRSPTKPLHLLDFSDPPSIQSCLCQSDTAIGGFSKASFDYVPASLSEPPHARFFGNISIDLPQNKPEIQQTGYAMWRSKDRPFTFFGKSLWDVDEYRYLALRVKSDGRKYLVNIQTESIVYSDIHQHRLYSKRPGEWETVLIKWSDFVRTNHGRVVEPQSEMLTQKIRTIGIGLTDRIQGPFDLAVSRLWATNKVIEGRAIEDASELSETPG